jgi:hypothetical protein
MMMKNLILRWTINWLILADEWLNTLTGGDPGETVSSRAGKGMLRGVLWCCILCRLLNYIDKNHCLKAIDASEGRRSIFPD